MISHVENTAGHYGPKTVYPYREKDSVAILLLRLLYSTKYIIKIGAGSRKPRLANQLLASFTRNLDLEEPPKRGPQSAAVSVILRDSASPSVLLIKRAERSGDPWSGQIAFPGGKAKPEDGTAKVTAVRETMEEVGIDLARAGDFIGYGKVTTTHIGNMDVVPSVFVLRGGTEVDVKPNDEVASFRWVELEEFLAPASRSQYRLNSGENEVVMPAFAVHDYVVWGLTYRVISSML